MTARSRSCRHLVAAAPVHRILLPTGEPIRDEAGNVVLNGDGTIFVASPDQGQIHNRHELRFDAVLLRSGAPIDVTNSTVLALGAFDFNTFLGSLAAGALGDATFASSDTVVNVIARTAFGTFELPASDWTFNRANDTLP